MRKVLLLVLLVLLVALPVAAQETLPDFIEHSECEVDLTGQEVTIYHFGDISASYAFITQPLLAGVADAAAYFNARGGICGATITQDNRDTAGDPAQTQAAYDYYSTLDPKPDMVVLYSSSDSELLRAQLAEDEIPVIISAGSVEGLAAAWVWKCWIRRKSSCRPPPTSPPTCRIWWIMAPTSCIPTHWPAARRLLPRPWLTWVSKTM